MPLPDATPETTQPPAEVPYEVRRRDLIEEYEREHEIPVEAYTHPPVEARTQPPVVAAPARAETPAPVLPKHSPRVLRMAQDLGFSQPEIDGASPEELDGAVYHTNRALQAELKRQREEAVSHRAAPPPVQPTPTPAEDQIDWGQDEGGQQLQEKDYAPAMARAIKRVHELEKRIKAQDERINFLTGREQVRETESNSDRIDRFFLAQDKALFGEGAAREMQPDSQHYAKRLAVFSEAKRLAGPQATNEQIIRALSPALKNLYGESAPEPEPQRRTPAKDPVNGRFTQSQLEDAWANGGVARPTHRKNAEEPKGVRRATEALRQKMEAAGVDDDHLAKELKGELPD